MLPDPGSLSMNIKDLRCGEQLELASMIKSIIKP